MQPADREPLNISIKVEMIEKPIFQRGQEEKGPLGGVGFCLGKENNHVLM